MKIALSPNWTSFYWKVGVKAFELLIPQFADYKSRNRLRRVFDIGVPNESAWVAKIHIVLEPEALVRERTDIPLEYRELSEGIVEEPEVVNINGGAFIAPVE